MLRSFFDKEFEDLFATDGSCSQQPADLLHAYEGLRQKRQTSSRASPERLAGRAHAFGSLPPGAVDLFSPAAAAMQRPHSNARSHKPDRPSVGTAPVQSVRLSHPPNPYLGAHSTTSQPGNISKFSLRGKGPSVPTGLALVKDTPVHNSSVAAARVVARQASRPSPGPDRDSEAALGKKRNGSGAQAVVAKARARPQDMKVNPSARPASANQPVPGTAKGKRLKELGANMRGQRLSPWGGSQGSEEADETSELISLMQYQDEDSVGASHPMSPPRLTSPHRAREYSSYRQHPPQWGPESSPSHTARSSQPISSTGSNSTTPVPTHMPAQHQHHPPADSQVAWPSAAQSTQMPAHHHRHSPTDPQVAWSPSTSSEGPPSTSASAAGPYHQQSSEEAALTCSAHGAVQQRVAEGASPTAFPDDTIHNSNASDWTERDGTMHNGTMPGSTISGSTARGRTVRDDTMHGGTMPGSTISDSTASVRTVRDDTMHDGTMPGSTISDSTARVRTVCNDTMHGRTMPGRSKSDSTVRDSEHEPAAAIMTVKDRAGDPEGKIAIAAAVRGAAAVQGAVQGAATVQGAGGQVEQANIQDVKRDVKSMAKRDVDRNVKSDVASMAMWDVNKDVAIMAEQSGKGVPSIGTSASLTFSQQPLPSPGTRPSATANVTFTNAPSSASIDSIPTARLSALGSSENKVPAVSIITGSSADTQHTDQANRVGAMTILRASADSPLSKVSSSSAGRQANPRIPGALAASEDSSAQKSDAHHRPASISDAFATSSAAPRTKVPMLSEMIRRFRESPPRPRRERAGLVVQPDSEALGGATSSSGQILQEQQPQQHAHSKKVVQEQQPQHHAHRQNHAHEQQPQPYAHSRKRAQEQLPHDAYQRTESPSPSPRKQRTQWQRQEQQSHQLAYSQTPSPSPSPPVRQSLRAQPAPDSPLASETQAVDTLANALLQRSRSLLKDREQIQQRIQSALLKFRAPYGGPPGDPADPALVKTLAGREGGRSPREGSSLGEKRQAGIVHDAAGDGVVKGLLSLQARVTGTRDGHGMTNEASVKDEGPPSWRKRLSYAARGGQHPNGATALSPASSPQPDATAGFKWTAPRRNSATHGKALIPMDDHTKARRTAGLFIPFSIQMGRIFSPSDYCKPGDQCHGQELSPRSGSPQIPLYQPEAPELNPAQQSDRRTQLLPTMACPEHTDAHPSPTLRHVDHMDADSFHLTEGTGGSNTFSPPLSGDSTHTGAYSFPVPRVSYDPSPTGSPSTPTQASAQPPPEFPDTQLAEHPHQPMFSTNLTDMYSPNTQLTERPHQQMFSTNLTDMYSPNTQAAERPHQQMFSTNLTDMYSPMSSHQPSPQAPAKYQPSQATSPAKHQPSQATSPATSTSPAKPQPSQATSPSTSTSPAMHATRSPPFHSPGFSPLLNSLMSESINNALYEKLVQAGSGGDDTGRHQSGTDPDQSHSLQRPPSRKGEASLPDPSHTDPDQSHSLQRPPNRKGEASLPDTSHSILRHPADVLSLDTNHMGHYNSGVLLGEDSDVLLLESPPGEASHTYGLDAEEGDDNLAVAGSAPEDLSYTVYRDGQGPLVQPHNSDPGIGDIPGLPYGGPSPAGIFNWEDGYVTPPGKQHRLSQTLGLSASLLGRLGVLDSSGSRSPLLASTESDRTTYSGVQVAGVISQTVCAALFGDESPLTSVDFSAFAAAPFTSHHHLLSTQAEGRGSGQGGSAQSWSAPQPELPYRGPSTSGSENGSQQRVGPSEGMRENEHRVSEAGIANSACFAFDADAGPGADACSFASDADAGTGHAAYSFAPEVDAGVTHSPGEGGGVGDEWGERTRTWRRPRHVEGTNLAGALGAAADDNLAGVLGAAADDLDGTQPSPTSKSHHPSCIVEVLESSDEESIMAEKEEGNMADTESILAVEVEGNVVDKDTSKEKEEEKKDNGVQQAADDAAAQAHPAPKEHAHGGSQRQHELVKQRPAELQAHVTEDPQIRHTHIPEDPQKEHASGGSQHQHELVEQRLAQLQAHVAEDPEIRHPPIPEDPQLEHASGGSQRQHELMEQQLAQLQAHVEELRMEVSPNMHKQRKLQAASSPERLLAGGSSKSQNLERPLAEGSSKTSTGNASMSAFGAVHLAASKDTVEQHLEQNSSGPGQGDVLSGPTGTPYMVFGTCPSDSNSITNMGGTSSGSSADAAHVPALVSAPFPPAPTSIPTPTSVATPTSVTTPTPAPVRPATTYTSLVDVGQLQLHGEDTVVKLLKQKIGTCMEQLKPTVTAQQMARVVRQRRRLRFAKQQQRLREFSDWLHEELRPQGTQQTRALKRALLSFRMVKQRSNHALRVRFARFVRTNNVLRIHWAGLEQAIGAGNVSPAKVHCIASCIPIGAPPCELETQAAFAAWVRKSKRALAHFGVLDELGCFFVVVLLEPFSGEARVSLAQPDVLGLRVEGDVARVFATIRIYLG
eukprot:gene20780-27604_t